MNLLEPSVSNSRSRATTKFRGSTYKCLDAQHAPLAKVFKRNFIATVLLFLLLLTGCGGQNGTSTASFNLKLASETLNLQQGETKTLEVSLEKLNGFSSSVALTISELPTGLSASFDPNTTTNVSTLSISASASAEVKETSLTLTGTAGSLVKTATLKLVVSAKEQNPNAPRISNIPSVTLVQNNLASAANPVSTFTLTTDKAMNTLTVTASSSNQSLIPNSSLNPTCDAAGACTMTYPVPRGQALNTDITVKVADAANQFNEISFSVAVGPRLVKTTADSGADSLRQHVLDAAAGDFIGFDSSFNSPKTITLSTGQIKLDKASSIDGTGKAVTIDANKTSRHFEIAPSTEVSISSLTLINGGPNASEQCTGETTPCGGSIFVQATASLNLNEVKILSNKAFLGGGINTNGTLTMLGGVLAKNEGGIGGAIRGRGAIIDLTNTVIGGTTPADANTTSFVGGGGQGGGIAISDTRLSLTNVTIQNNTTAGQGGGISENFSAGGFENLIAISASRISDNQATLEGGGIFVSTATLAISDESTISNNSAKDGGGIFWNNSNLLASLSVTDSAITGNKASEQGGAVFLADSTGKPLTFSNSTISDNESLLDGGAIFHDQGILTITNSTLSNNQSLITELTPGGDPNPAGDGGGAIFNKAILLIDSSSLQANTAPDGAGGAIFNQGGTSSISKSVLFENEDKVKGGAILIEGGSVNIVNSTLSKNKSFRGAAIADFTGTSSLEIRNSTIAGNLTDNNFTGGGLDLFTTPVTLYSTIVANNSFLNAKISSTVTSQGMNLDSGSNVGLDQPLDIENTDPLLGPLQDNGGLTFTMALGAGSPAIDKGACEGDIGNGFDQRGEGFQRIVNDPAITNSVDGCDMGAFEKQ